MPSMTKAGYTPPKSAKAPKGRPRGGPGKKKKRRGPSTASLASLAVFALAAAIGAGTLYLYTQTSPYREAFAPGTSFEGSALTGYGYEDGVSIVRQATAARVDGWRFEVDCMGTQYVLTAADVGLGVDAQEALDPLWRRGKGNMVGAWLDLLALRRQPQDAAPTPVYDLTAADAMLELVRQDVEREPQDARVTFAPGDAEPFRFEEETVGLRLDTAPLREAIEASLQAMTPGQATAEPEEIAPQVTADALRAATVLRARVTLALVDDEAAYANAALAANSLNGLCVGEGEALSFNAAVGERTAASGYAEAPEPAYGEDARGPGGGVCQTATALYQAALLGGVTVSERHAAAQPVPYAKAGLEAAVSDQGLDLALKNDTGMPLYVTARAYRDGDAGYVQMELIGAPLGARYALETSERVLPAPQEPVYVRDSEGLYATYMDERVPVVEAKDGLAASVYRVTLDKDGSELSREKLGEDEYAPTSQAIYVGVQHRPE